MRVRSYLPVAIAIVLAAVLSVVAAVAAVGKIETSARIDLSRALAEDGHDWAQVAVDGLQVIMVGTAPDEAARFGALSAAGRVIDAARIVDRMEVRPAREVETPEYKVEILRNLDGISLIGLVPAGIDRAAILERLGRLDGTPVSDLLEEASYPKPQGWDLAVEFALRALARIPRSKVSVTADRIAVTGIVDSEQVRRQVESELGRQVPSGVRLSLEISAPRPVIAPFTVRFVAAGDSRRFDACAAETPEMRDAILGAAWKAGLTGQSRCQIGLGAPSLEWAEAVALGIAAVDRLEAATITYSDADVSLVAAHTVPQAAFDREAGLLERTLPEGFSLTAVRTPPPASEEDTSVGAEETPEFRAVLSLETGVELLGRLPDARSQAIVESYAKAHFGAGDTTAATRVDADLPEGWPLRVMAGLDALAQLGEGSVLVRADFLRVAGETGSEDAAAAIARLLSERLGDGARYEIDVSYEERLDPEAGLPTPEECVAQLNDVLDEKKISFEPGSATVDAGGLEIIDRLAELLRPCEDVRMEIAGHTDSQGRESMNQRLSQERANAVLSAILARRVLVSNLTARGYGESSPIADNGTEEGREANRRIEFTLLLDDDDAGEEAAAEAGAGDEEPEEGANEQN